MVRKWAAGSGWHDATPWTPAGLAGSRPGTPSLFGYFAKMVQLGLRNVQLGCFSSGGATRVEQGFSPAIIAPNQCGLQPLRYLARLFQQVPEEYRKQTKAPSVCSGLRKPLV